MRYEDVRRLRGVEGVWFRLKLWWKPATTCLQAPLISNFSHLSDHERRDIGLPEQVRYANWHELKERGGLS
ncbi:hypothetical protein [Microvirga puerhi]|uniref:DUF1127 domain-containing protein n=1 Tax=Microvirga puerhi TaxID=2876078 RepID=A0ABS7VHU4_9HYPH|nr:hypothetical protein [Microvirga puerhi]MBZ6075081.1 hypothetical protein [Microvirga puerhi]